MPRRQLPLQNGQIYHVYNRGQNHQLTFASNLHYQRAMSTLEFYLKSQPISFSSYIRQTLIARSGLLSNNNNADQKVDIIAYCLMPNHFHLLLRQNSQNGISHYLSLFQNSYTKYFNQLNKRQGPLFSTQFKAVHISSKEQLLHTSRYIHLNPYASSISKTVEGCLAYPWSSISAYISEQASSKLASSCDNTSILCEFPSKQSYLRFITDNADYQRLLATNKPTSEVLWGDNLRGWSDFNL